jgi:hypothetical protein
VGEFPEHGDFDVLYALKGMLPEALQLGSDSVKFWNYIKTLPIKTERQATALSRSSSPSKDRASRVFSVPKPDRSPMVLFSYREQQVYW